MSLAPSPVRYPWAVEESPDFGKYEEDIEPEVEVTSETAVRLEVEKLPHSFEFAETATGLDRGAGQGAAASSLADGSERSY